MAGIAAYDVNTPLAANNFAAFADPPNASSDLHILTAVPFCNPSGSLALANRRLSSRRTIRAPQTPRSTSATQEIPTAPRDAGCRLGEAAKYRPAHETSTRRVIYGKGSLFWPPLVWQIPKLGKNSKLSLWRRFFAAPTFSSGVRSAPPIVSSHDPQLLFRH